MFCKKEFCSCWNAFCWRWGWFCIGKGEGCWNGWISLSKLFMFGLGNWCGCCCCFGFFCFFFNFCSFIFKFAMFCKKLLPWCCSCCCCCCCCICCCSSCSWCMWNCIDGFELFCISNMGFIVFEGGLMFLCIGFIWDGGNCGWGGGEGFDILKNMFSYSFLWELLSCIMLLLLLSLSWLRIFWGGVLTFVFVFMVLNSLLKYDCGWCCNSFSELSINVFMFCKWDWDFIAEGLGSSLSSSFKCGMSKSNVFGSCWLVFGGLISSPRMLLKLKSCSKKFLLLCWFKVLFLFWLLLLLLVLLLLPLLISFNDCCTFILIFVFVVNSFLFVRTCPNILLSCSISSNGEFDNELEFMLLLLILLLLLLSLKICFVSTVVTFGLLLFSPSSKSFNVLGGFTLLTVLLLVLVLSLGLFVFSFLFSVFLFVLFILLLLSFLLSLMSLFTFPLSVVVVVLESNDTVGISWLLSFLESSSFVFVFLSFFFFSVFSFVLFVFTLK